MDNEIILMSEALVKSGYNVKHHPEPVRAENLAFMHDVSLGEELKAFFSIHSFDEGVQIGEFWYDQVNCFKKEFTWDEYFTRCVTSRLLPVGNCSTGDPIVLDLLDLKICFVFHDIFWEDDGIDPRACLIKMDCSIGQFYFNSTVIEGYPIDAYSAQDYMNEKLADLK